MKCQLLVGIAATVAIAAGVQSRAQSPETTVLLRRIDHLVYATPDLAAGIQRIEAMLGIRATPGGQHPGEGTRNALVALGPASYLEIIARDPEQPEPGTPRKFGIDNLRAPRLVTWAAKGNDLGPMVVEARRRGVMLGDVIPGSRRTPSGALLSWHITSQRTVIADGLVPFFIDWGQTPHPAATAATGATLIALRAEHPDPERVRKILDELGFDLPVTRGATPALIATIAGPHGRVELR
jgi:hypothetical protein